MSKYSFLIFLSATLIMTSCDDDDDEEPNPGPSGPTQNIAELASASPQFSILVEILNATNLVDAVADENASLTVFAPNNDAFNAFFDAENLTDDNNNGSRVDDAIAAFGEQDIIDVLLYHVLGSEVPASAIAEQIYQPTLSTASPNADALSILVEPAGGTVAINGASDKGATVAAADIFATNGVIHEIDAVLGLPNLVDHAIANSALSELVGNVVDAMLVDALSNPDAALTVFAPVNDAFTSIQSTVDELSDAQLVSVLQYHVLGSQVRSGALSSGNQTTLEGQEITIDVIVNASDNLTGVTITDASGGVSNVVLSLTDIQGTNGVVHVIDRVLIPVL